MRTRYRPRESVQLVFCETCKLHADIVRMSGGKPEILSSTPIFNRAVGLDEVHALIENMQITGNEEIALMRAIRQRCFGNDRDLGELMLSANKVHHGQLFPNLADILQPSPLEEYYLNFGTVKPN